MGRQDITSEIRKRALHHEGQPRLLVDYYRIRRHLSFPLPITTAREPAIPTALVSPYPWNIWMVWALEERLNALAWSAEHDDHAGHRQLVEAQMQAFGQWPQLSREDNRPDLLLGHVSRLLARAHRSWTWLTPPTQKVIAQVCQRVVNEHQPWIDTNLSHYAQPAPWTDPTTGRRPMANIPLIGLFGAAMAATVVNHALASQLLTLSRHAMQDYFDHFQEKGYSEAVAYDGYMLDFYADLTLLQPAKVQSEMIAHPAVASILATSWQTAVTGDAVNVAQLGDVEPYQMTFHLSAHAKLLPLTSLATSRWHLDRCDNHLLRTDALMAMLADGSISEKGEAPPAAACRSQNAVVLRTGWEADDLTAALSVSRSTMGHIHPDTGSLVLGTQGQWLISDPGYQQYLAKRERAFTLGPGSHNLPVINGATQEYRGRGVVLQCDQQGDGVGHTLIDMTACYNTEQCPLSRVTREAWLLASRALVVVDIIEAAQLQRVSWSWHGHPAAGWWVENGVATLQLGQTLLWIATHDQSLAETQLDRMPGSRGQQTLCLQQKLEDAASTRPSRVVRWWVFNLGQAPQPFTLGEGLGRMSIDGKSLSCFTG